MKQIIQNAGGDSIDCLTFSDPNIQVGVWNIKECLIANYCPAYALLKQCF